MLLGMVEKPWDAMLGFKLPRWCYQSWNHQIDISSKKKPCPLWTKKQTFPRIIVHLESLSLREPWLPGKCYRHHEPWNRSHKLIKQHKYIFSYSCEIHWRWCFPRVQLCSFFKWYHPWRESAGSPISRSHLSQLASSSLSFRVNIQNI